MTLKESKIKKNFINEVATIHKTNIGHNYTKVNLCTKYNDNSVWDWIYVKTEYTEDRIIEDCFRVLRGQNNK